MNLTIKSASNETEIKAAFGLVQALAEHENSATYLKITEAQFVEAASEPTPKIRILVALNDNNVVGMATYLERFHIWNAGNVFVLDDLYVTPEARGHGIGTKLLETLGQQAKARGVTVKWQVQADNHGAIALYKRLGADFYTSGICFWRPENI